MTLSHFLSILWARRRIALAVWFSIVLAALAYSLLQQRQYLATASVLIDNRSADPVATPANAGSTTNSAYMATQIDLLQSERVALLAIRTVGLQDNAAWRALWQEATGGRGVFEPWLAEQLLKKLDVKPSRESNVVNIGFLSTDPAFSAVVANAFVRAYSDTVLELKVEPAKQANVFFDERVRQLRAGLEQAQGRLSGYQQAKGIVATDDRLDVENARLAELSSQLVIAQGQAAESAGRRGLSGADSQEVLSNLTIGTITADLSRQEARLSELRERLGERNPQVVELVASIAQLRARLASETRRVATSLGVNSQVAQSRVAQAQGALNEQRAKVLRVRGQRDEASVLVRDVDSAQRAYDAALARVSQSSLESQSVFTNVMVVRTATPPPFAATPRTLLNTAVAVVIGALLAAGVALIRELRDRRLRFDTDVSEALGQHLLIRLPRIDLDRAGSGGNRLALRKSRLLGHAPGASA